MQQAQRVADFTAFFSTDESRVGQMVEFGTTDQIFNKREDRLLQRNRIYK
jgi:phosphate transport system ATP-binding protein